MNKNIRDQKPASFSLIIIGIILIAVWLFASEPWNNIENSSLFHLLIDDGMDVFYLPIALLGIFLLALGLLRLLHASWDKKNKSQNSNPDIKK